MPGKRLPLRAVMLLTGLLCLIAIVVLARSQTSATVFLLVLGSLALLLCEYMSAQLFFSESPRTFFGLSAPQSFAFVAVVSVVMGVLLEIGTLIGAPIASPFNLPDWSAKRIALFSFMVFGGLLFRYWYWDGNPLKPLALEIRSAFTAIGGKRVAVVCCVALLLAVLGTVIFVVAGYGPIHSAMFFITAAIAVAMLAIFWRHLDSHPEYAFFGIVVAAGICIAASVPTMTLVSWDDEIHYENAASLSYVFNGEMSDAELRIRHPQYFLEEETDFPMTYASTVQSGVSWEEDSIASHEAFVDYSMEHYGYRPASGDFTPLSYQSFGYIPAAMGLWVSRLLHLPFTMGFLTGKLFTLLFYAVVCFAAIRIMPTKKVLVAVISLLPTGVFLASNYSYDPWVISVLGLAVALTVRMICCPESPADMKSFVAVSIAFVVGLGPKAVYFPLIGLLLLVPRRKFKTPKNRWRFVLAVVVLACVVLSSFVIPFLVTSGGAGDLRGGSEVDPSGQIHFMLSHPGEAAFIFARFIFGDYFSLPSTDNFTMLFAYLGSLKNWAPWLSGIPTLFLALVAIVDNKRDEKICGLGGKLFTFVLFMVSVVLINVALYVSFTPVGRDMVYGIQGRYLLPLLVPLLAICSSVPFRNRISSGVIARTCLSASALLLFASICLMIPLRIIA